MDRNISQIRWMSALDIILGAWIAVSPWALGYTSTAAIVNSLIFGIGIIVFGVVREAMPSMIWSSWVNFAAGIWVIISPFILQMNTMAAYWNLVITGVLVGIISYANANTHATSHPAM